MESNVSKDNEYGRRMLSPHQLGKRISRQSWAIGALAVAVVASSAANIATSKDRPLLLHNGVILTEYKTAQDKLTADERALIARSTYEGLRRRTGIGPVDGSTVGSWLSNVTTNGVNSWQGLGERWKKINFVQPGFSRAIRVASVSPDKVTPYAFTINAVENESEVNKPLNDKSYKVRLTLYFTDPAVNGVSMLDGVALHEEEEVK